MSHLMQFYAERERLTKFPVVPSAPPSQTVLVARATRDVASAVCDLVTAAQQATSRAEILALQARCEELQLQLEAVVSVTKDVRFQKFTQFLQGA